MNLAIMGPPGAGKGTVCKRIIENFKYKYICAGDLLRSEKDSGSELGKEIAQLIDNGNLVPDQIITDLVRAEFRKPKKIGTFFLVDGYPRTLKQATFLDSTINVPIVIWLDVSEETTIERNLKRGLTSGRPDDLNEEVIRKRLENYYKDSLPIKKYYGDRVFTILGEGSPDDVYNRIIEVIRK